MRCDGCGREVEQGSVRMPYPKWIPVKDRLPKDYEEVLVFLGDGYYLASTWEGHFSDQDCNPVNPSYWMPLPDPPKGEWVDVPERGTFMPKNSKEYKAHQKKSSNFYKLKTVTSIKGE